MDQQLKAEIQSQFGNASPSAYEAIRDNYLLVLHGPYDQIREEICKCITMQMYQAAITLTNHYLELFVKDCLIFNYCGDAQFKGPETFKKYQEGAELYDGRVLGKTLKLALDQKLLTQEEFNQLDVYRETMRNAYGHAEKGKIMDGLPSVNYVFGKLDQSEPNISGSTDAKSYYLAHGLMQQGLASQQAIPYFLYVDELVFKAERRRHPEIDQNPHHYIRQF